MKGGKPRTGEPITSRKMPSVRSAEPPLYYASHSITLSNIRGIMLPTVFLSLSGVDANFVSNVERNIPPGMAYFYPKSFENGENLISAMEERVAESRIFVLFASHASVNSVWVKFEIERARLNKIQNPGFKYFVFPVEPGVDRAKLPAWMREAWIPSAGHTAKDIARYLRGVLASMAELSGTILPPSEEAASSTRHAVSIRLPRLPTRFPQACSCSPATPALVAERSNASSFRRSSRHGLR